MFPELNPLKLLQSALAESRFLRILILVAGLGWGLLLVAFLTRDVLPRLVGLLYFFHIFCWYFALATRSGFLKHQELMKTPGAATAAYVADYICQGLLFFCQVLFLLAVFRLFETP